MSGCGGRRIVYSSGCGSGGGGALERQMQEMMDQAMAALQEAGRGGQVSVKGCSGQRPTVLVKLDNGRYLRGYAPNDQSGFDDDSDEEEDSDDSEVSDEDAEEDEEEEEEEEEKEEKPQQCNPRTGVCQQKEEKPKEETTYSEHFLGEAKLVDADGRPVNARRLLENKVVALYFSAHWCGPCRRFTPQLKELFDDLSSNFSVIFVSSDKSRQEMFDYMKEAHGDWAAIDYDDPLREGLQDQFDTNGIPSLIIVKADGSAVTREGVSEVSDRGLGAFSAWKKHFNLKKKGEMS